MEEVVAVKKKCVVYIYVNMGGCFCFAVTGMNIHLSIILSGSICTVYTVLVSIFNDTKFYPIPMVNCVLELLFCVFIYSYINMGSSFTSLDLPVYVHFGLRIWAQ